MAAGKGRVLEKEAEVKARENPGRHVTPDELNELALDTESETESESQFTQTERSNLETLRHNAKLEEKKELTNVYEVSMSNKNAALPDPSVPKSLESFRKNQMSKMVQRLGPQITDKQRESFKRRKFNRFVEPPNWVMVDKTFDTYRRIRCRKNFYEDYSSSSEDEGYWGKDYDNVLSDDE